MLLLGRVFAAFVFAVVLVVSSSAVTLRAAPPTVTLQLFATEAAAQKHCPNDEVVWLNTASGIYHEKRWYGRTKHGAFVCRREADAAGDRDTRNGQ